MSNFIKDFKKHFSGLVGLILVVVLACFLIYVNLNTSDILNFFRYSLPYVILGIAVVIAVLKGKHLLAYLILMIQYSGNAHSFLEYLFGGLKGDFPLRNFFLFLIFLFLILQVVSYAFDTKQGSSNWTTLALTIFIAFLVEFYYGSFFGALVFLFYPIIGYIAGTPLISSLLMMFVYIPSVFDLVDYIKNDSNSTSDLIHIIFGIIFLVLAIIHFIDRMKKEK